jgi:hypothetical protein
MGKKRLVGSCPKAGRTEIMVSQEVSANWPGYCIRGGG